MQMYFYIAACTHVFIYSSVRAYNDRWVSRCTVAIKNVSLTHHISPRWPKKTILTRVVPTCRVRRESISSLIWTAEEVVEGLNYEEILTHFFPLSHISYCVFWRVTPDWGGCIFEDVIDWRAVKWINTSELRDGSFLDSRAVSDSVRLQGRDTESWPGILRGPQSLCVFK